LAGASTPKGVILKGYGEGRGGLEKWHNKNIIVPLLKERSYHYHSAPQIKKISSHNFLFSFGLLDVTILLKSISAPNSNLNESARQSYL
jgi:hypothetical protein